MDQASESREALEGLLGTSNESELLKPRVKPSLESSWAAIVAAYALLAAVGAALNLGLLVLVAVRRLHRQPAMGPTMCLLANLAVAHLVQCLAGLPLTLAGMLFANWVLGGFCCYFLPMIQDIPIHVSVLTFVVMAYDRYRFIEDPSKQRLPAVVFAIGTWLTASCIVVPYPIYTTFLEISLPWHEDSKDGGGPDGGRSPGGAAGQPEQKLQLCVANLGNDIHDYLRCMFVLLYVVPAISLAYLHAQTSRVLREKRTPVTLVLYEPRAARSPRPSAASLPLTGCRRSAPIRSSLYQTDSAELDLAKETRTQRYLCVMTASFFALFAPLNLMRVLKMHLHETYENTFNFDIAFATLVWVGYLPTCTMPIIVGNWMLSRSEKERVRGYLRFSYRRLTRSGHRSTYSRPPGQAGPPADAVAADDHTALSTPGPSPPHGVAHGNRTASVATASTAITNLSPPTSPKPSPRPSPRPARGSTAAPAAAAVLPAPAAAPLSEVNLMKHDLQRVPSHRHRIPLGPASPSTSTSSSRTSSSFLHNPFLPIGPPAPSSVDSPVPTTSDSTPTSPPAPATGLPGLLPEASLSRLPSLRSHHRRGSSRRRKPTGHRIDDGERIEDRPGGMHGQQRIDDRTGGMHGQQRIDDRTGGMHGPQRLEDRAGGMHGPQRREDRAGGMHGQQRIEDRAGGMHGQQRVEDRAGGMHGQQRVEDRAGGMHGQQRVEDRVGGMHGMHPQHRMDLVDSHRVENRAGMQRMDLLDSHRIEDRAGMGAAVGAPQSFHQAVHQGLHKPPHPPRYFTFDQVEHVAGRPHHHRP